MDGFKIALFFFVPLAIASLFVPIVNNPNPLDCNNYPDGSGGYYSKCKDDYVSIIKKWKIEKEMKRVADIETVKKALETKSIGTQ